MKVEADWLGILICEKVAEEVLQVFCESKKIIKIKY